MSFTFDKSWWWTVVSEKREEDESNQNFLMIMLTEGIELIVF